MKTLKYIIAALSLVLCMNAFAETRYVSENIVTYMRSGASDNHRFTGTLKVGTPVSILSTNTTTKFMQVKTSKGKIGWVKISDLQKTLPAKNLLPAVQEQLQEAQAKLKNIASENSKALEEKVQAIQEKDNLIVRLESEKKTLQETIEDLKAKNLELDLLQDTKDERIKMEWMMYGGSVLFFGLLLGLIIPFLPRRKKRQNNW